MDPFKYIPLTFAFNMADLSFYDDLQDFCKFFLSIENKCNLKNVKAKSWNETYGDNKKPVYYEFGTKFRHSRITPRYRNFQNYKSEEIKLSSVYFSKAKCNMWILKPGGLSRARGLEIFDKLEELKKFINEYQNGYSIKNYFYFQISEEDRKIHLAQEKIENNDINEYEENLEKNKIKNSVEKFVKEEGFGYNTKNIDKKGKFSFNIEKNEKRSSSVPEKFSKNNSKNNSKKASLYILFSS